MPFLEYGKTENLFTRDPDTHKVNIGDIRVPEFALIKTWHLTEKIDGTNMRICYDPKNQSVEIRGRSDRANIPGDLLKRMQDMFPLELLQRQFDEYLGDQIELGTTVTIYGEGYGAGIQSGGGYRPDKSFRVFDICYHRHTGLNSWCQMDTVDMICGQMNVLRVPILSEHLSIEGAVEVVKMMSENGENSRTAWDDSKSKIISEGIVGRTNPYLYDEMGRRIMWKLKVKDLPE